MKKGTGIKKLITNPFCVNNIVYKKPLPGQEQQQEPEENCIIVTL